MARKVGEVFVEVRANLSKLRAGMKSAIGIASGGASAIGKVMGGLARIIGSTLKAAFTIVATAVKAVMTVVVNLFKSMIKWAKRGLLALTAFIAISVVVGAKFGQSMAKVKALTGASTKDFKAMREEALRLGKATEFSAGQAADAMGIFAMAGFKTKEIIQAVAPTLDFAAASGLEMAAAADIAARVMGGMQLKATELTHATDVMTKAFTSANMDATDVGMAMQFVGAVGKTLGKDLEEVVGTITALAGAGIRGSMAGTGLRKVLMQLANKKVQNDLAAIGVSVTDAAGAMKPISKIIGDITRASKNMTDMEVADLGLQMFGARGGVAFLALMGQGEQAIHDHTEALRGADGLTKKIAETMRDTLATSFKLVQSAAADLSIAVSDVFEPFLRQGNEQMVKFFNGLALLIRSNTGILQTWIGKFRDWFMTDVPNYATYLLGVFAQMFDRIKYIFVQIGRLTKMGFEKVEGALGLSPTKDLEGVEGEVKKSIFQRVFDVIVVAVTTATVRIKQAVQDVIAVFDLLAAVLRLVAVGGIAAARKIGGATVQGVLSGMPGLGVVGDVAGNLLGGAIRGENTGATAAALGGVLGAAGRIGGASPEERQAEVDAAIDSVRSGLSTVGDVLSGKGAGGIGGEGARERGKSILDVVLGPLKALGGAAMKKDFEQRRDKLIDMVLPFRGAFEGAVSRKPGAGRQVSMADASMEQVLLPAMSGAIQTALGTAKVGLDEAMVLRRKNTDANQRTADALDGAMSEGTA
jgi:TP901 family phage tail tape measure protein